MYFLSFVVNLLSWMAIGILIGDRTYSLLRRNESSIYLFAGLGGLLGGILSSMVHGMYPRIGIDLFNLMWAGMAALGTIYVLVPSARNYVFVRLFREIKARYGIFLDPALWKRNITTLIPR